MIRPHMKKESTVPWWAAFGAPLVGVPLLVGLLALAAPGERVSTEVPETDATVVQEDRDVDADGVHASESTALELEGVPLARC